MERLFTIQLEGWKTSPNRKPLIIRGARQVGKSFSVNQFGRTSFSGKIHVVDFEKHPDWRGIFFKDLEPGRIINELEILLNSRITIGEDLLFFDEIQAAPSAIMALRYFFEEMPGLHLIAAGSLLEFAMKDISFPVGRVNILKMSPMNFTEFLMATGKAQLAEIIRSKPENLSDPVHNLLLESVRHFMFVGGMPECVEVWRNSHSMTDVFKTQSDLVETYRQDFSKYAPYADKRSLNHALSAVAKNIGRLIKYTRLSDDFTGPVNKKALDLLSLAQVVHRVHAASPASLPLAATASEKKFKTLLVDIGLMQSLNDIPVQVEYYKNDLLSMYQGALAEQFVGQEFLSAGWENLHFWARDAKSSSAEVDYLIVRKNGICPIEVKGGSAGKLRSMHQLLKEYPMIERGYILSTAPYGELPDQKLTFLPLYYAFALATGEGSTH